MEGKKKGFFLAGRYLRLRLAVCSMSAPAAGGGAGAAGGAAAEAN